MFQLKYIIKFLLSLIINPEQTWRYLSDSTIKEADPEFVHRNYYLPFFGGSAAIIFLSCGLDVEGFDLERAMKNMVPFLVAYFAGPFMATLVLKYVCVQIGSIVVPKPRLEMFVAYSISYLMFVEVLSRIISTIAFIPFASIYIIFIVWNSTEMLGVIEKSRVTFSLFSSFTLFLSPRILQMLMGFLEK